MSTSPNFLARATGSFAALAVSTMVLLIPAPASAQTTPAAPPAARNEVRIDLSGQTPEAARAQIAAAARDVCRDAATHSPLFPRETSDCRIETVKQAIAQLGDAPTQVATR
jgi:hypothetical protein